MKKQILVLIAVLFLLISCRQENLVYEQQNDKVNFETNIISKQQFQKNKIVFNEFLRIKNKAFSNKNLSGKTTQDSLMQGAIININEILTIKKGANETYTFMVSRSYPTNKIENLVLRKNADSTYSGMLVQYDLTSQEKQRYLKNQYVNLHGKIKSFVINNTSLAGKQTYSYYDGCMEIVYESHPCGGTEHHSYENNSCPLIGTEGAAQPTEVIAIINHCGEQDSGGTTYGSGVPTYESGQGEGSPLPNGGFYTFMYVSIGYQYYDTEDPNDPNYNLWMETGSFFNSLGADINQLRNTNPDLFYYTFFYFKENGVNASTQAFIAERLTALNNWYVNMNGSANASLTANQYFLNNAFYYLVNINTDASMQQFQNYFLNPNINLNVSNEVIKYLIDTGYVFPIFTVDNYPGKDDGMPFEWWKDNNWMKNNIRMDGNKPNEEPNSTELMLFSAFPLQASFHVKNSNNALAVANQLVASGKYSHIHNGKADAFRHTFWNALDSSDFGKKITLLFTTAHEIGSTNHPLETQMDIHNNEQGAQLGTNYSTFTSATTIKDAVITMMDSTSNIWYLSPLANHDGNNILTTTQIIPTN